MNTGGRVVVYTELRRAHVERHSRDPQTTVLYRRLNYDLTIEPAGKFVRRGVLGLLCALIRARPTHLELNEPASWRALPTISTCILAVLTLRVTRRAAAQVTAYAIENLDPSISLTNRLGLRSTIAKRVVRACLRSVGRRYDRVAFGTQGAREMYFAGQYLRQSVLDASKTFSPLAPQCNCTLGGQKERVALFLGTFDDRKGIELALAAWKESGAADSGFEMLVLGQGPLTQKVVDEANRLHGVKVIERPDNETIHWALRRAALLIAPSQRTPVWREQIGLPILEGLSHGCTILTSTETGIAQWLVDNGHDALAPDSSSELWALALTRRLHSPLDPSKVLATLPPTDGRLDAEDWLGE